MADRSMKFNLDFLPKLDGLKRAKDGVDDVADSLDDTESAAKQAADAMRQAADKIDADLKETTELADRLAAALGPEMAAKIGQSNLTSMSTKLRDIGIDASATDADIDALADGIRGLDQSADQVKASLGGVDTEMKNLDATTEKVGHTTDNTRSVVANFTGNMASELPGAASAMGPLNMAIGQFGEYAAEGNIQMMSFIKAAGPMAGAAVAFELVSRYMKEIAAVKAWRSAEVKAFVDSIKKGSDAAQDFKDRLLEAGKVEWNLNRLFGGDALGDLAQAGVTIDQFTAAVMGGPEALQRLSDAMLAAGVDGGTLFNVVAAAKSEQDQYNQAVKTAAELQRVGLIPATKDAATEMRHFSDAANEAKIKTDAMRKASEQLAEMIAGLDDDNSLLNLQQGFDDLKQLAIDNWYAVASGAMTAEEATRNLTIATNDQKIAVAEYGTEVAKLPAEQVTNLVVNMDLSTLDTLESRLNLLSQTKVYIHAGLIADSSLRNLMEDRGGLALQVKAGQRG